MDRTVARLNIENYRKLLTREIDETKRQSGDIACRFQKPNPKNSAVLGVAVVFIGVSLAQIYLYAGMSIWV
jgi:hypothetical protein